MKTIIKQPIYSAYCPRCNKYILDTRKPTACTACKGKIRLCIR